MELYEKRIHIGEMSENRSDSHTRFLSNTFGRGPWSSFSHQRKKGLHDGFATSLRALQAAVGKSQIFLRLCHLEIMT